MENEFSDNNNIYQLLGALVDNFPITGPNLTCCMSSPLSLPFDFLSLPLSYQNKGITPPPKLTKCNRPNLNFTEIQEAVFLKMQVVQV